MDSGGLGGNAIKSLACIGSAKPMDDDGHVIDAGNLNRQPYAREDYLGFTKVDEAKKRVKKSHSGVHVMPTHKKTTKDSALGLLTARDLVLEAAHED